MADRHLNDHGHLLSRDHLLGGTDVVLRRLEVRRGVDELDCFGEPPQTRGSVRLVVRDHLGLVDAGEGLEPVVFQQAARPDRQRRVHLVDQRLEITDNLLGQVRLLKRVGDLVVGQLGVGDLVESVALHKGVEHVGGHDRQGRDIDRDPGERVTVESRLDRLADEHQPLGLAAEPAAADTTERRPQLNGSPVEPGQVLGCEAAVAHSAIIADRTGGAARELK
jgi:hypothetical protein